MADTNMGLMTLMDVLRNTITDGEWIEPTPRRGYLLGCCTCGTVHRLNFRLKGRAIQFQAFRDAKATKVLQSSQQRIQR